MKGKIGGGDGILTHEETLQLLSEMAKAGSVTAAVALARELRLDPARRKTSWTTSLSGFSAGMTEAVALRHWRRFHSLS